MTPASPGKPDQMSPFQASHPHEDRQRTLTQLCCTRPVRSLADFLGLLEQAVPDPSERGKRFERYLRDALLVSPAHQFEKVWLWDEWPERDGPDVGIDLVAEDADGELWAIQSKLYSSDRTLTWKDLSTWVAATRSERWTQRLLVSTTSNLSRNAERELRGDPKTSMLLGEYLHELPVG